MLNVKRAVILLVAFASQVIQGMLKLHAHYVSNVYSVSNQPLIYFLPPLFILHVSQRMLSMFIFHSWITDRTSVSCGLSSK